MTPRISNERGAGHATETSSKHNHVHSQTADTQALYLSPSHTHTHVLTPPHTVPIINRFQITSRHIKSSTNHKSIRMHQNHTKCLHPPSVPNRSFRPLPLSISAKPASSASYRHHTPLQAWQSSMGEGDWSDGMGSAPPSAHTTPRCTQVPTGQHSAPLRRGQSWVTRQAQAPGQHFLL